MVQSLYLNGQKKLIIYVIQHILADGDSKSYTTVANAKPYGPLVDILKEECTSHITKRMGTGLREIVKSCKGENNFFFTYNHL